MLNSSKEAVPMDDVIAILKELERQMNLLKQEIEELKDEKKGDFA